MKTLNDAEIKIKLNEIPGWEYKENQITREIKLRDFKSAVSLLNKAADEAEKMDHHPDILIFSWNKIRFTLSTHSEGGITKKDFELAAKINQLISGTEN